MIFDEFIKAYDKKKLRRKFLTLMFAVVPFVFGLGMLVYGLTLHAIATRSSQSSDTIPSIQVPSETDKNTDSRAPVGNESNSNSSDSKSGEKKRSAKDH